MKTKIIVEFASSWNGDPELMKAMIKSAAENGADICKLQDYRAKNVPDSDLDKARYQKYQVPDELYPQFIKWCEEFGVEPLVTCFNVDRIEYLASLGLKKIKLASISLTNTELLMMAGANFEEVIVSTAMHNKEEIEQAIQQLSSSVYKFTIMSCVANYPTLPKDANLERINELKKIVGDPKYASVGYSDHSLDLDVSKSAISMGIKYIEKHFSLSRYTPQIPHQMYKDGKYLTTHEISIEPHELRELADWRDKVELMQGVGEFKTNDVEDKIKDRYQHRYGK